MTTLETILNAKEREVEQRSSLFPVKLLEKSIYFNSSPVSLKKYLLRDDLSGLIAEFKRRSPSKGYINRYADVERITIGYMQSGASALSVLTDHEFFGGNSEDLSTARKFNFCPILRKDFIVSEYQVIEAKSIGADVILLIAAALSKQQIRDYTQLAHDLGMEVLLELHEESELEKISDKSNIIGINNRDLKTMQVDLAVSHAMVSKLPPGAIKISESGITTPTQLQELKEVGYHGFLMGEHFMRHSRPEQACSEFIKQVKQLRKQVIAQ